MLELGYAIGIGKRVIITSSTEVELPPHLRNFTFINSGLRSNDRIDEIIILLRKMSNEKNVNLVEDNLQEVNYHNLHDFLKLLLDTPENIQNIDAQEFENIVFEWFKYNDYHPEWADLKKDYGFDFVIHHHGERILVDVKKYAPNSYISVMKVQQLLGAIYAYHAMGGLLSLLRDLLIQLEILH